jgi:hypothetical protein
MRLRAPRHSLRHVSSSYYTPQARSIELSAEYEPSRHDAQMLDVRTVPADPYMAWLDQREAERRSSTTAEPTMRRLTATESRDRVTA